MKMRTRGPLFFCLIVQVCFQGQEVRFGGYVATFFRNVRWSLSTIEKMKMRVCR